MSYIIENKMLIKIKENITNRPALYTGLTMQLAPVVIAVIVAIGYAISRIDFTWTIELSKILFTEGNMKYSIAALIIILYYTLSWLLVKIGISAEK